MSAYVGIIKQLNYSTQPTTVSRFGAVLPKWTLIAENVSWIWLVSSGAVSSFESKPLIWKVSRLRQSKNAIYENTSCFNIWQTLLLPIQQLHIYKIAQKETYISLCMLITCHWSHDWCAPVTAVVYRTTGVRRWEYNESTFIQVLAAAF